ncbi:MAG: alpha/beta fold hydrolase [Betaproteobacteria bacterium]|nr:alpha/beta fold hydrolase [Betaproteobacteria bacterium]
MIAGSQRHLIDGPAGTLEAAVTAPEGTARGSALIAHPHPLYGGTMENKVVQTLARTFVALGYRAWRVNFRGVGASEGVYDDGRGELDDFRALARHAREQDPGGTLVLAGFSFGGYVVAHLAAELEPERLVLVAPAVGRFPVSDVPAHTLVIHGEEDDVVALPDVFAWARPQKLPIVVIPGAGHFFHGDLLKVQQIVREHHPDHR